MRSFKLLFDRRAQLVVVAAALLLSAILPALASAAQLSTRSIQLSSSSADADGVKYTVNFTAAQNAGAIVVDFCGNSPLIGSSCTAPVGFSASGAATASSGYTITNAGTSTVRLTKTMVASDNVSFELTGINNPTGAGALYARILTYTSDADAATYTDTDPDNAGANVHKDDGGVAMYITDTIGVSAAVLETMTFCVSGEEPVGHTNPITASCGGTLAPTLTLGELTGTVRALSSSVVSTADIYTQISTNASGGAVVSLKSGVACGGLKRVNAADCDIVPAQQTNITGGQAKFGVVANADSAKDTTLGATGTYQIKTGSGYSATDYALNYNPDTSSGVTSAYGDPILDTGDTPTQPSNKNMKLTFGASIAPNTPAGLYKGDLSLIATGTF